MAAYDYLELALKPGAAMRRQFVERLVGAGLGGRVGAVGLFSAQLGWDAAQVSLLAERGEGRSVLSPQAIAEAPEVVAHVSYRLEPTVRPTPGAALWPGGIYVHRWFEVAADSFDAFVALSAEAWPDFEGRFDAKVFGLFAVAADPAREAGANRQLLLITRYASHGVWEDSRDPSTAAMQTFARRASLTLHTQAASTLLVPL